MNNCPFRHTLGIKECKYYTFKKPKTILKQSKRVFWGLEKNKGRLENKIYTKLYKIYNFFISIMLIYSNFLQLCIL